MKSRREQLDLDEGRTDGNPFATRFVRPGALEYVFAAGESPAAMIERLAAHGWWGQIVGPHGTGKSTLVASLLHPLAAAGRPSVVFALRDGQRALRADWIEQARAARAAMIVIDGYEQLSRWSRFRLKRASRRRGWGLLVTTHGDVGFATVARTHGRLAVVNTVVAQLLPAGDTIVEPAAVSECFAASGGNVREALFALYDHYERRRRQRS